MVYDKNTLSKLPRPTIYSDVRHGSFMKANSRYSWYRPHKISTMNDNNNNNNNNNNKSNQPMRSKSILSLAAAASAVASTKSFTFIKTPVAIKTHKSASVGAPVHHRNQPRVYTPRSHHKKHRSSCPLSSLQYKHSSDTDDHTTLTTKESSDDEKFPRVISILNSYDTTPEPSEHSTQVILTTPPPLPGDTDVKCYIDEYATYFYDDPKTFLVGPTKRTQKALTKFNQLLTKEREAGGVLSCDTNTPSTITSHPPGYLLSKEDDIIVGLQADEPLKRTCKPHGGYGVVKKALESYGYTPGEKLKAFEHDVITHNDLTFSMYTDEMKLARHAHLLTGLPDGYGRGRIIADYRRIALYGVDELIRRKEMDFAAITGSSLESMRLRSEISMQINALKQLLEMADEYGVDLRKPAKTFREAAQALWLGHAAALKQQDGAASKYLCYVYCVSF